MAIVRDTGSGYPSAPDRSYPQYRRLPSRDATIFQQPWPGGVARSQQDKLQETVSAEDFGATPSTTKSQSAAIQKALDTGKDVWIDAGTYKMSEPIRFRKECQRLYAKGKHSTAGTRLYFDAGVTEGIIADSVAEGVVLYDCEVSNVLINRPAYADGTAIVLNKAPGFIGKNLIIQQFNRCVDSFGSVNTFWHRTVMSAKKPGGWCMRLRGDTNNTGGIAVISYATWDCTDNGSGLTGLGQEADGLVIEGAAATITTYSLQIVRARYAMACLQGPDGTGLTDNPYFIYNYDFQSDRTGTCGVYIERGNDIVFDRGWIQGGYNPFDTVTPRGAAIYQAPGNTKLTFRGHIGGHAYNGVDVGGSQVIIEPSTIARCSAPLGSFPGYPYVQTSTNTYDNVVIRSTASQVDIRGGSIGTNENGSGSARYNVRVEAGATKVRLMGVDLTGALTGPLRDDTNGEVQVIGCVGLTNVLRASAGNYVELGNANGIAARIGSAVANGINLLRIACSPAGSPPSIIAEGTDTDIGLVFATKGTGAGRLRVGTSDRLVWDSTRVDATVPLRLPTYTVATLPAASQYTRCLVYVSDGTTNHRLAISDGVNWRWPEGTIVS